MKKFDITIFVNAEGASKYMAKRHNNVLGAISEIAYGLSNNYEDAKRWGIGANQIVDFRNVNIESFDDDGDVYSELVADATLVVEDNETTEEAVENCMWWVYYHTSYEIRDDNFNVVDEFEMEGHASLR